MAGTSDDNQGSITGINVTPLVDVMLVLLIIFMATAPMLQRQALHVSIPKASKTERVATETTRVEFGPKDACYLDGKKMSRDDLMKTLTALVAREPATHVSVAADVGLSYGAVISFLDDIRAAGVQRVGLEVRKK